MHPTLALAQRLWDEPVELLTTAESGHRLERHGLLERPQRDTTVDWRGALFTPALVVRTLLFPSAPTRRRSSAASRGRTASGSRRTGLARLEIVPVIGPRGADHAEAAADACTTAGRAVDASSAGPRRSARRACSRRSRARAGCAASTYSWISTPPPRCSPPARCALPSAALGLRLLLAVEGRGGPAEVPPGLLAPAVHVPPLSYEARVALWRRELGSEVVGDVARRFRFEAGGDPRRSPAACGATARSRPSGS